MDIIVNVNIDTNGEKPKVKVMKAPDAEAGGVLRFPEQQVSENNSILDMLGIGRT